MKKYFVPVFFLLQVCVTAFAQNTDCKTAEDSILIRKNRGEIAYYYPTKFLVNQYFYIVFSNDSYSKKQMPLNSFSDDFLKCYNKASQKILDSVFKVDFFRKTDSILNTYDKAGRGYRSLDLPGGAAELQKFMKKNVSLSGGSKPMDADKFIRVYYSFLVDEAGKISDIKLVKSNCKECEEPVLVAIKKLPDFIPATEAGCLKKVKYILPFVSKF